jgi:hypothetical protein
MRLELDYYSNLSLEFEAVIELATKGCLDEA